MIEAITTGTGGQEGDSALPPEGPRPRLLIVEDNPVSRLMLGGVADQSGLDHVAVGCIEEALLRFAREGFDAVLVDVEMDGGAGMVLARLIAAMSGESVPPVLGFGDHPDPDALAEAGFSGTLAAPVEGGRLIEALIGALERDLGVAPAM